MINDLLPLFPLLIVAGQPATYVVMSFVSAEIKDFFYADVDYMLTKWGV